MKVHKYRFGNLPISLSSHENNMPEISNYSIFLFFDIDTRKICEMFVYKHLETIKYAKNLRTF